MSRLPDAPSRARSYATSVAYAALAVVAACTDAPLPTEATRLGAAAAPAAVVVPQQAAGVTFMTYNIYQGTELEHVTSATSLQTLVGAVARDYAMMLQTNFAERAIAIAGEVQRTQPDLIGLQEVALWRSGPYAPVPTPATTVDQDFLQILVDALAARGMHYAVVASVQNFDTQAPGIFPTGLRMIRLTDRNVILARTDGANHGIQLSNPQGANFAAASTIPFVTGPITVREGWAAVDVKAQGRMLRFITTHLEAGARAPAIRLAQAAELLAGPANTTLDVVLAGDLNSTTDTDAYVLLRSAGLRDAWADLRPSEPGFTAYQVTSSINNPISTLWKRIDYALVRGALAAEHVELVGDTPSTRTPSGLWPSDHAGLVAAIGHVRGQ